LIGTREEKYIMPTVGNDISNDTHEVLTSSISVTTPRYVFGGNEDI